MIKYDFTTVKCERPRLFDELFVYEHETKDQYQVEGIIGREPDNIEFLKRELKPGMNFVDVGGYEGYFSIIAAKLGAGKIFTFEPVTTSVEIIKANRELHKVKDMTVFQSAISNKVEHSTIIWRPGCECCSKMYENPNDLNYQNHDQVSTFTLDFLQENIFKDIPIHIMKVDIEGYEIELFDGAKEFFNQNKGCKVMLEVHSHFITHDRVAQLKEFLQRLWSEFNVLEFNMDPYPRAAYDNIYAGNGSTNLFLVHK